MNIDKIIIKGAREHNLKNINLEYTYRDNMDYILGNNHVLGFILKLNNFSK